MKEDHAFDLQPFGEADCASEVKLLKSRYSDYYFQQTRFNETALERNTYLVIGRRGSGKTALANYFSFQGKIRNAISIDIDEPELFHSFMRKISSNKQDSREIEIPRLVKVWEFCIWLIIFSEMRDYDPRIKAASLVGDESGKIAQLVIHTLKALVTKLVGTSDTHIADELEGLLNDARISLGKDAVLEIARQRPIIVAIDTLENYSIGDDAMMRAVASLIQFGSNFTRDYGPQNIHLKIFVMAEIFPYLKEAIVLNPLKHIRNEIYLHWRPKDLMRLISWRLFYFLRSRSLIQAHLHREINWDDHQDVFKKVWVPYFGENLVNGHGLPERTFPYVLRHSQMRPRQLIVLCNSIAQSAGLDANTQFFTGFSPKDLVQGIKQIETHLATEVYSAYNEVYPNVSNIIESLSGISMQFRGSDLDKRAPTTASQWSGDQTHAEYSPYNFRQLVAELGIVGRIRRINKSAGYIEADFEYFSEDRLPILPTDHCVIHPMFYRNLNVKIDQDMRVYPFPDHPEFIEWEYR